jgi:multidrug efflux pump subunit AcrB
MASPDIQRPAAQARAESAEAQPHEIIPPGEAERSGSRLAGGIVKYYRIYVIAVVALLVFGGWAFQTMPRTEDPEFDVADVYVITLFPGALASKVENLVTRPIEEAVEELDGIETVSSQSIGGLSIVTAKSEDDADPAEVKDDIADRIKELRGKLPAEAFEPDVTGFNTANIPAILISLYGPDDYKVLDRWADFLDDELSALPLVSSVDVEGLPQRQIQVKVDNARLAQYGIPLTRLHQALRMENAAVPGGRFDVGVRRYLLKNPNEYESVEDIRNTVVGSFKGSVVYLRDLAQVVDGHEEGRYRARTNGQQAVMLAVMKRDKTNTIAVASQVRDRLEELRKLVPAELEMRVVSDRGKSVAQLLGGLQSNALQGGVILAVVVALFLGVREAVIVSITIPLSVLIALIAMRFFSIDLNQVSIFGLVLALGNVVDASLVVVENISRKIHEGDPLRTAVTVGTQEVTASVVNSVLTTVASTAPLLFMTGDMGRFIYPMPMTLTFAMFASAIVGLTITPLLCFAVWMNSRGHHAEPEREWKIMARYVDLAKFALRHRFLVLVFAVGLFALSLATIPFLGVQFFPKAEKTFFIIDVTLSREANIATTDLITRQVENILGREEPVRDYTVNVGKGSPRIYYNIHREAEKQNFAQILVNLKDDFDGSVDDYVAALQQKLSSISGATVEAKVLQQGPSSGAPIQVRLSGDSLDRLVVLSAQVRERIRDLPGLADLRDDTGEKAAQLQLDLDRQRAGVVGVDTFSFSRTLFMALNGEVATLYRDGDDEVPVVVELDSSSLDEVSDLERLYLPTGAGGVIPFAEVAAVRQVADFTQINRRDGQRTVTVEADTRGALPSQLMPEIEKRLADLKLDPGYGISFGGENEERDRSFAALGRALGVAMLVIYGLLAMQFNSFVQPIVILLTVPFGIVGAIFGLFLTGRPFGFMAFLGIVGLCGVVIADSIMLTDVANYLQRVEGMRMFEALVEAARSRVKPVLATMATTIAGLLPMAFFGGSLWSPLAVATVFGDVASTFLILVLMPVIYSVLVRPKESKRAFRLWRRLWERLTRRDA